MNRDEALRCLEISKEKFKAGNTQSALKFANKSIALCETPEGMSWLSFLSTHSTSTKPTASSSARDAASTARRRSASASAADSSKAEAAPSRPFTPDQVEGIKRIKACKAQGDLYAVLDLKKGCSDSDIKKAYRKVRTGDTSNGERCILCERSEQLRPSQFNILVASGASRLALQFHPDKCGAPGTDDAFKAIGHAFAVLGDADKKAKYDRFGIDSDSSRAGGGGGGGGGGMNGFYGNQFESEISPEDIFNMFFGGQGGPGMRMHSFTSGPGFGRQHPFHSAARTRAHHQRAQTEDEPLLNLARLLPFFMIFILPLLSSLFSTLTSSGGISDPAPTFSFMNTQTYDMERKTKPRQVQYYVNSRQWNRWRAPKERPQEVRGFENDVEQEWRRHLQSYCQQEQEQRRFRINQAYGWFKVDEKRLRAAEQMKMPNCDALHKWR
ncbi:uncharacterized protein EV422DRAFT_328380 [Fimicolochytrium jonesii]|uniref:uncharacterized protein n=1 Tax=Fimicolochytrium jonesii TaxID=1396493 RepID=UPI0022FEE56E|nr:uncharacterized protein EV422DRAFT_328380 [Fimicolochytrium jonesii]KAI8816154.1 hypothetical protein EV422DRAFT_328380 [Fimicolochytrium jonesii]